MEGLIEQINREPKIYLLKSSSVKQTMTTANLFAYYLYQYSLVAPAIELSIKDLFPRTKVELAIRNRHHNLSPHNLALVMSITVIFSGAIVMISFGTRVKGRQPLEPAFVILVQSGLIVVDEDARGDVHGIYEA